MSSTVFFASYVQSNPQSLTESSMFIDAGHESGEEDRGIGNRKKTWAENTMN